MSPSYVQEPNFMEQFWRSKGKKVTSMVQDDLKEDKEEAEFTLSASLCCSMNEERGGWRRGGANHNVGTTIEWEERENLNLEKQNFLGESLERGQNIQLEARGLVLQESSGGRYPDARRREGTIYRPGE
ncbi:hypothetical protein EYF80_050490 [Liparis tanakae]|uniref:Uncharacterized protein n=1 Tax=Liparis tanakae TaxID=230148 RepID=A0A4Z2FG15_9TELE|nr:hypothetical protein EYF80_050490 [Liparis tanakae]